MNKGKFLERGRESNLGSQLPVNPCGTWLFLDLQNVTEICSSHLVPFHPISSHRYVRAYGTIAALPLFPFGKSLRKEGLSISLHPMLDLALLVFFTHVFASTPINLTPLRCTIPNQPFHPVPGRIPFRLHLPAGLSSGMGLTRPP